ncbi:MAG: metalloregulator ArsR/SmtB family transcription factor [bacterium]|nr:metalloregulator ArsR/SmtB family transcription factor [bacterium]
MSSSTYQQYTRLLKALANQKRIEILRILCDTSVTVTELIHMSGMSQSNVSQHLQVLRRNGIVVTKRQGKEKLYRLAHPTFIKLLENIHEVLSDRKSIRPLRHKLSAPSVPKITDPVCGMSVSPRHAVFTHEYKRTTYYFCASGCRKNFILHPKKYV